ncbi:MAG TPA: bifunctional YncE family protein/alkaline phosphatase family protein [Acidobacteriaceae bacterium]|jgi:DNA-binding beta-propeller fold protein YncE|nr:bifunctional YncE family protein/alkaline phosphatase family protein [Acidobacteriaceae bacterium]
MIRPILRISSCAVLVFAALASGAQTVNLPSSKQIIGPVPGSPERLNSFPMGAAWSPDHRYLALVNAGFGTVESNYEQSIAILDTSTGKLTDFPEVRTDHRARQTYYSGIAFSADGAHLYVSFDSLSDPNATTEGDIGNAVGVYRFSDGAITAERTIPVPLRTLAPGKLQHHGAMDLAENQAIPAPAGLAVVKDVKGGEQLLVADEYSDDALLLDAATGKLERRFDLSSGPVIPTTYPMAVAASPDGRRAWVSLWNGSAVAELDLRAGTVVQRLPLLPPARFYDPSSHPIALTLSPDRKTLYVALANRDQIAAVAVGGPAMRITAVYPTRLPGQAYFGAIPDAVALSEDGATLYAANSGSDAIAVINLRAKPGSGAYQLPIGFIPTEWYPTALAVSGNHLYVATAKGEGTGPNANPQPDPPHPTPGEEKELRRPHTYIASMLHGSLATIDVDDARSHMKELTEEVLRSNLMYAAQKRIKFQGGGDRIHHVIYIIKENRTYDQILGDLGVGDGDASLTMYGQDVTPNLHALARQFGVLDNFYDSGEVSGDGHVWSNAAISSDYTERTWQIGYRGSERPYDFEGVTEGGYPLLEHIPDVDEPGSGYLWTDLARHHKTLYHFGEFISTEFCDKSLTAAPLQMPQQGGTPEGHHYCAHPFIDKGDPLPANYGGGLSPYPWPIPLIYKNVATMPELVGHFDPLYPDFNLSFPDQLRVNEFLVHFRQWVADLRQGHDTMPQFVMLRLPNDHTAGTRPGMPTPRASVADNDLAVGRAVDVISHSPYWDSTAFFILEDDAQDGADHVDAHRSISLVVSKYAPHNATPLIDHTFYTTVSTVHTMLTLLGVPPMNNNDAFAPLMAPEFAGAGDQPSYNADYRNRDNGLIYTANSPKAEGARESARMDFTHEDRAPARELNIILWKDAMGSKPVPYILLHPQAPRKDKDDDGD